MTDYAVAIVATSHEWANRVALHCRDFGPLLADQLSELDTAFDRDWQVLLIDASSAMTTVEFVGLVQSCGRAVLGVWHSEDPTGKQRCLDAGIETSGALIEAGATTAEFVAAAADLAATLPPRSGRPPRRAPARAAARRGGELVAVGGPMRSGSDVVAIGLAQCLAAREVPVVLVDANELFPSVALLLGLSPDPNLASAVAAERTGGVVDPHLQSFGGSWVLAGLAEPSQWAEASARGVTSTLLGLAARFTHTVVCVGPVAEAGERFATTRSVLAEADIVVGVSDASPEGLRWLGTWLADVRALAPHTPLYLVATGADGNRHRQGQVVDYLTGLAGASGVFLLPADPGRRRRKAEWNGTPLRGPLLRSVRQMTDVVVPRPAKEAK